MLIDLALRLVVDGKIPLTVSHTKFLNFSGIYRFHIFCQSPSSLQTCLANSLVHWIATEWPEFIEYLFELLWCHILLSSWLELIRRIWMIFWTSCGCKSSFQRPKFQLLISSLIKPDTEKSFNPSIRVVSQNISLPPIQGSSHTSYKIYPIHHLISLTNKS